MNNKEINSMIETLNVTMWTFEDYMMENEGICDETSDQMEEQIAVIKELLTTEGVDSLGRWLKAKEDEIKTLKAEKDSVNRKISAVNNTIDYIKTQINKVMVQTGTEMVKGTFYSFKPTTSVKTEVNKELLKAIYEDKVKDALIMAHIPCYVGVSLTASATKAKEFGVVEGDEELFNETSTPSVRFTKPRASKKEEE